MLGLSRLFSPSSVARRGDATRAYLRIAATYVRSLPIRRNILKFDFTRKDMLTDKVVVHPNVLCQCVENRVLCELDVAEVVIVDRRCIAHLLLQVPK